MSSSGTLPQTLSGTIPTDSDYAEMARRPLACRAVRSHRRRHAGKIAARRSGKKNGSCETYSYSFAWLES